MNIDQKNSFWLALQYISTIVFSLIILKINLSQFGTELFDIWILLSSIWFLGTAIDLGLGTALVKFIAEKLSIKKENEIAELLSSGFLIFMILGVIIVIAGFMIGYVLYISNEKIVQLHYQSSALTVFILLSAQFYLRYLTILYRSFFEGFNNYALISKISIFQNIILLSFVVFVAVMNYSIEWLSLFYFFSSVITITIYISAKKIVEPQYEIKLSNFNYAKTKSLLKFSLAIQGSTILNALLDPVIKFIIGTYAPAGNVSLYEIAKRFASSISGLYYSSFRNILPKTSVLLNYTNQQSFFSKEGFSYMRFGTVYSAIMFGTFSILFILIINEFFGYQESIIIFLILGLAEAVNNVGYTMYVFFIGIGKLLLLILIQLLNLSLTSICLVVGYLILEDNLGLLAYFISVLVSNLLMVVYLHRKFEIRINQFIKNTNLIKFSILIITMLIFLFSVKAQLLNTIQLSIIYSMVISFIFFNDYSENFNKLKEMFFRKFR